MQEYTDLETVNVPRALVPESQDYFWVSHDPLEDERWLYLMPSRPLQVVRHCLPSLSLNGFTPANVKFIGQGNAVALNSYHLFERIEREQKIFLDALIARDLLLEKDQATFWRWHINRGITNFMFFGTRFKGSVGDIYLGVQLARTEWMGYGVAADSDYLYTGCGIPHV